MADGLTEACLAPFQLAPRFRFVLTSEDITRGKPDPEIYLLAARRFGVPPAEMLVLEDSQNGCRAAAASGAFTVAVPGEHSRRQDFGAANLVIENLADRRLYEVLGIAVEEWTPTCLRSVDLVEKCDFATAGPAPAERVFGHYTQSTIAVRRFFAFSVARP